MATFSNLLRTNPIQSLSPALQKWGSHSCNKKGHTLRKKNVENSVWRVFGMEMDMGRDRDKRTREMAIEELLKISKYPNRLLW